MAHPTTDTLGAIIITATWWHLGNPVPQLPGDGSPNDLFIGLSTLSGLVLAKYYHLDFNDGHFTFIFTLPMGDKSHYLFRNRNL